MRAPSASRLRVRLMLLVLLATAPALGLTLMHLGGRAPSGDHAGRGKRAPAGPSPWRGREEMIAAFTPHHVNCADAPPSYYPSLIRDVRERTETAMAQSHCFKVAGLALMAQAQATQIGPRGAS
jgi:hypothetical protein